jgi:hypothetical protein
LDIATEVVQHSTDQFLASRMVNEHRLQPGQNLHVLLDGKVFLGMLRFVWRKCVARKFMRETAQFQRIGRRAHNVQSAFIKLPPPFVIVQLGV